MMQDIAVSSDRSSGTCDFWRTPPGFGLSCELHKVPWLRSPRMCILLVEARVGFADQAQGFRDKKKASHQRAEICTQCLMSCTEMPHAGLPT